MGGSGLIFLYPVGTGRGPTFAGFVWGGVICDMSEVKEAPGSSSAMRLLPQDMSEEEIAALTRSANLMGGTCRSRYNESPVRRRTLIGSAEGAATPRAIVASRAPRRVEPGHGTHQGDADHTRDQILHRR